MLTIEDFKANPSNYVWYQNGNIVIDSQFNKFFLGDKKLLLCCIEDNIGESEGEEHIRYYDAIEDYKKSL